MKPATIHYAIRASNPEAHLFEVRCTVSTANPAGQRFALPAWIPGSYLIRDFARHIVSIRAESAGKAVTLTKIDKHTWQAIPTGEKRSSLTVSCEVYAWDLSVRGAHLDQTHAFFNGSSVFLRAVGHEHLPCLVDIQRPLGKRYHNWRVATALSPAEGERGTAHRHGFGTYRAASYAELIDHPVELGDFTLAAFSACGVPHEVVISGRHDCDLARLTGDLERLCAWQIRFFGEPAPMPSYLFLVTAVADGYGGLEHRASTALLCARNDLPYAGMKGTPERYVAFLGLCSHEYFHSWNIKRIRPDAFTAGNLDAENYTTLLWAFEGFTSYYDDLALLRCGLIDQKEWLRLVARTIGKVRRDPGRKRQTLAESSFDAWTKYYRPDENTPNAVVSYYAKGALVALALDLTLRAGTNGRVSLDDVMRALWLRHGERAGHDGVGVGDDDIRLLAEELSGLELEPFFAAAIHGTAELALAPLLKPFGIRLRRQKTSMTPTLGAKTSTDGNEVRLATVYQDSPAQAAGLSAGDLLVAIDGLRVTPDSLEPLLCRRHAGETIRVHAFRRDELMDFTVQLGSPASDKHKLVLKKKRNTLRDGWLQDAAKC
ncbi:MAG: peptidase Do [Candidatus Accumulibacter regalis]|jgi:predicted metalloprotease with PDZ domain|uniref:Peptidase Do n=1 Tax=Accumulibacter regalis TaxID=522306 RepID=A0A011RE94_ACCRE|nr:PDZ domain-containing protein [Accumulibacter sp.]EXI89549.1 MAG: peptidase Do [Candidatus Accumulibacter regalis]MQM34777.1 peptidase M61 [Candidatus Accumulibacter phosphatis]MBL8366326.1 M61 family metallopeptidase [Accumulibacter sp.]MBN8512924.1 M61 family metallopeptidase [Accumulibacter sp.]MBO3702854.1 M61 family metallopeptidase [Accumulibacter sp.]